MVQRMGQVLKTASQEKDATVSAQYITDYCNAMQEQGGHFPILPIIIILAAVAAIALVVVKKGKRHKRK